MLLPALAKARSKAKAISCASNLKQVGTCFLFYQNDFNDFFPPYTMFGGLTWVWGFCSFQYADSKTFVCPTYINNISTSSGGYGYNYMVLAWHKDALANINRCVSAAKQYVVMDKSDAIGTTVYSYQPGSDTGRAAPRHEQTLNMLYADDHVEGFFIANILNVYGTGTWNSAPLAGTIGRSDKKSTAPSVVNNGWSQIR